MGAIVTKSNKHINPKEKERIVQAQLLSQSHWQLAAGTGGAGAKRPSSWRTFPGRRPTREARDSPDLCARLPDMLIAVSAANCRFPHLLRFRALGLICKSPDQPKFDSSGFAFASSQILREQGNDVSWNKEFLKKITPDNK